MNEKENLEETEPSSEERFKQAIEKLRPYINNLWAARKKMMIVNGIILVLTIVYLLFLARPYYTSIVTILPEYGSKSSSMLSQLSGLASLAGVNVGEGSTPTEIYQNLISSEAVLSPVIYAKYKTNEYSDSVNLIQYFEIDPDKSLSPDLQKRYMFLKEFKNLTEKSLSVTVDKKTKILTIMAEMPEAQLSADVANKVTASLDNYIRTKRKSYSTEQRQYIEKRLGQVKDSLNNAENRLMYFKEQNRVVNQSPALILEQSRLSRAAEILNSVYLELFKQLELAKIDEVKDTPILNIKETAKNPVLKTGPKRIVTTVVIFFFALLLSALYFMFSTRIKLYYGLVTGIASRK